MCILYVFTNGTVSWVDPCGTPQRDLACCYVSGRHHHVDDHRVMELHEVTVALE